MDSNKENHSGIEVKSPLSRLNSAASRASTTYVEPQTDTQYATTVEKSRELKISNDVKKLILFDAIGVQFHTAVFLYQLGVHLFLPFFFFVRNKGAQGIRFDFPAIWFNIMQPLFVYLMVITYNLCPNDTFVLIEGSIWIPLVYFFSHRLIIALKYASLSPTEYKKFQDAACNLELGIHYRSQMQLISGWIQLEPSVLYFELGAASARMGVKLNEIFIRICTRGKEHASYSQFRYWNAFVRGHDTVDWSSKPAPELRFFPKENAHAISVYDACIAVIRRANENVDPYSYLAYILSVLVTIIVICVSYMPLTDNASPDVDAYGAIFLVSSTCISFTMGPLFYYILYTSVIEVKRLLRIYRILHCMIRLTDLMMASSLSLSANNVTDCDEKIASMRADAILSIGQFDYSSIQAKPLRLGELEKNSVMFSSVRNMTEEEGALLNDPEDESIEKDCSRESFVLGERLAVDNGYAMTPRISFEHPENVMGWVYCRLAIQNFGDRFRNRIDIYVAGNCLVAVLLMVFSLMNIVLAEDRHKAFGSVLFIQAFITVTVLFVILAILFYCGAIVNDELNNHKVTLASRALIISRKKLAHLRYHQEDCAGVDYRKKAEYYQVVTDCIDDALEILAINSELKPLKILGINAQIALVISIATTAITFYSALLSLYANTNNFSSATAATGLPE